MKTKYNVTGMSCAACQSRVEKAVAKVPGVETVSVSLLTNSMMVEGTATEDAICQAVQAAGYGIHAPEETASVKQTVKKDETELNLIHRLIASVVFLVILMYVSMGHMMWGWPLPPFMAKNHVAMGLTQMLLTIIVMVINERFFISGYRALWRRSPNMDSLVALGSTASFGYSVFALYAMTAAQMANDTELVMHYMDEMYFESAAMILTLITVGKMLEAKAKGRTTDALKGLMKLAPQTAILLREGKEQTVPVEHVKVGDLFVIYPGQSIPVDGRILEGNSAIDESALTGESIPVDKKPGDNVSAGTMNRSGYLRCEATGVGKDTTLAGIIQMVSDASATKAPIAKLADRVAGIFVPTVMGIALVTFLVWFLTGHPVGYSLARAISVLVISCPCALGLATPVAIMVGNGIGARNGILFKTAAALEATGEVKTVILDKTGTITKGQPQVTDVIPAAGITAKELLHAALLLEERSEHPLAKAIVTYAGQNGISADGTSLKAFSVIPGRGLCGTAKDTSLPYYGGQREYIVQMLGGAADLTLLRVGELLAPEGKTPLYFAAGNRFLGVIAVADVIKEESAEAVRELKSMGLQVVMLTGDHEDTARVIGEAAGVDRVIAGVLPEGKEKIVREYQKRGKVVMVGDGINDAPALAAADVGMAIGAGTDIAMDAAEVVLMKSSLMDAVAAIRLSRKTLRNIRENLFWAFFYNILGIPLAAGVWIPIFGWTLDPMFGAAAMSLSSFCVVTNALRLNLCKIYNKQEKTEDKKMVKTIRIQGMMCGHCEATVKKALESLSGVEQAVVSHDAGTAVVTLTGEVADDELKKAVEDKDFTVTGIE